MPYTVDDDGNLSYKSWEKLQQLKKEKKEKAIKKARRVEVEFKNEWKERHSRYIGANLIRLYFDVTDSDAYFVVALLGFRVNVRYYRKKYFERITYKVEKTKVR